MSTLIVACILAIIAIFAYAVYAHYQISKAECSKDTDCNTSYTCQSGKCAPSGTVAPPGTVTPPGAATSGTVTPSGTAPSGANYIVCNSDNCPLPNTCQNNQCVSPCSLTNCLSPKICDENNQCITPMCTPDQIAKIFPPDNDSMGDSTYGPCTGIDDKYLSFDKTYAPLLVNRIDIPTTSADGCKAACDKKPSCTAWIHDNLRRRGLTGCQLSTSTLNPPLYTLNIVDLDADALGQFKYNEFPESVYSTNVKVTALV
jgi:hypothetical protein